MRCRCAFHKLKIIVYFCIPNLIVVTKQRDGKFANDSCLEKTRKEKKKKKRFQGWRLNARMNGTWLGRMEFLPIRVIRWATKNRRNCRGWKICLVRMLHFDLRGDAINFCDARWTISSRILATFSKRIREKYKFGQRETRIFVFCMKNSSIPRLIDLCLRLISIRLTSISR